MESILQFLWQCSFSQIIVIATVENILILIISLIWGQILVKKFQNRPVSSDMGSIQKAELILSFSTLFLNIVVTLLGWVLWKEGFIFINASTNFWIVVRDTFVLFFIMDFLMYVLHRVAHIKFIFPILHKTHHNYINVRPLTLFVLNPLETLSFGSLWLILICFYSASGLAIFIYLSINVIFGLMGHLGVEPIPEKIANQPFINLLTTSTFHAQHHQNKDYNFGFYTNIWDKLFKSLSPYFHSHYGKLIDK